MRTRKASSIAAALILSAGAVVLASCSGGGSVTPTGVVRVAMTDAPACGFERVFVTVQRIRFHRSASAGENDSGWVDLAVNPPRRIDLLELQNGRLAELGQASLEAGQYTQMRLVLAPNPGTGAPANAVVPTGGGEVPLTTPSGVQSGIKLVNTFTVEEGKTADILIDFDACRSIVIRGNGGYLLKPVLEVVPRNTTAINGFVEEALVGALVTAQRSGAVVRSTVVDTSGSFSLAFLDPAQGPLDVVITAPGRATTVIAAVPLSDDAIREIATASAPITAPVSTMRSARGAITPASAEATVRALQTVGSLPRVEVAFVNTSAGDYSLSLPIAAPRLAIYSTTLPLNFLAQTSNAAKYTLEASAEGFATRTQPIDITTNNAVWDVALQ